MNIGYWKIRQRFHFLRLENKTLRDQIYNLKEILDTEQYHASEAESRLQAKLNRVQREADDAQRREEYERSDREYEIRKIIGDLDRAQSYEDSYSVEEAMRKLRRLT